MSSDQYNGRNILRRIESFVLSVFILFSVFLPNMTAYAEETQEVVEKQLSEGVTLRYNADGTETLTVEAIPEEIESEPDRFSLHDGVYESNGGDVNLQIEKTFEEGETLVTLTDGATGVSFYPVVTDREPERTAASDTSDAVTPETKSTEEPTQGTPTLPKETVTPAPKEAETPAADETATSMPTEEETPVPEEDTVAAKKSEPTQEIGGGTGKEVVKDIVRASYRVLFDEEEQTTAEPTADPEEEETPAPMEAPVVEAVMTPEPEGTEEAAPVSDAEPTPDNQETAEPEPVCSTGKRSGTDEIVYPSVFDEETDLVFYAKTNGVKEDIVIGEYTGDHVFSYHMDFDGLVPVRSGSRIDLYRSGEKVGEISEPDMRDAKGAYSTAITVSLKKEGKGYLLTYTPSDDWLASEERKYPVTVDPSVTYTGTTTYDIEGNYVSSSSPNTTYTYNSSKIYAGGSNIAYIRPVIPDSLKNVSSRVLIVSASLNLYARSGSGILKSHLVNSSWSSRTITYNNRPSYNATVLQSKSVSSGWNSFDLTAAFLQWFNVRGQKENCGIALEGSGNICFASEDTPNNRMNFSVTYYRVDEASTLTVTPVQQDKSSGYVDLSWSSIPNANGYYVGVYNGKSYEYTYVGNVTSWTTKGKGIWPTAAEIGSGRYLLHWDGTGSELPSNPNSTYRNAVSTNTSLAYSFDVQPARVLGAYIQAANPGYRQTCVFPNALVPTQPTSVQTSPSTWTNLNSLSVSWAGITDWLSDGTKLTTLETGGAIQYRIDSETVWSDTGSLDGSGTYALDVASLADGTHTVYLRGLDKDGNEGAPLGAYLYLDRTPPSAPEVTTIPADWTAEETATVYWSGISESASGLKKVEYRIDNGAWIDTGSAESDGSFLLDTSTFSDGPHTVYVRGVDLAGNNGEEGSVALGRDTTAPVLSDLKADPASWTDADQIRVTWTGPKETGSGLKSFVYQLDGGDPYPVSGTELTIDTTKLTDGKHTVTFLCTDKTDNTSQQEISFYTDRTVPTARITSPTTGDKGNGALNIRGTAEDACRIGSWTLTASTDKETKTIATGTENLSESLLTTFDTSAYADGDKILFLLTVTDAAGHIMSDAVTVTVDRSMSDVMSSIQIESPTGTVTDATVRGRYSGGKENAYVYVDGEVLCSAEDRKFSFDAIRYPENSEHTLTVISDSNSKDLLYSDGLALLVIGSGAPKTGEVYTSVPLTANRNILALHLDATATGTVRYSVSEDNGSTWQEITTEHDFRLTSTTRSVLFRAEPDSGATLNGWTLSAVIEKDPTTVKVSLSGSVTKVQITGPNPLSAVPVQTLTTDLPETGIRKKVLYENGERASDAFEYLTLKTKEGGTVSLTALAQDASGGICASGNAGTSLLLRETPDATATEIITGQIPVGADAYTVRVKALTEGSGCSFYVSTDAVTWKQIEPDTYEILDKASNTLSFKAIQAKPGQLKAWHIEAVTATGTTFTVRTEQAPTGVVAKDYGTDSTKRFELSWTAPKNAGTGTKYILYKNGTEYATTTVTAFTDPVYVSGAVYTVVARHTYAYEANGAEGMYLVRDSAATTAQNVKIKSKTTTETETNELVDYTDAQTLKERYGDTYLYTADMLTPPESEQLSQKLLGSNQYCARGFEPINFNTGNFYLSATDFTLKDLGGTLSMTRMYNSQSTVDDGPFGAGWSFPYSQRLELYTEGNIGYRSSEGALTVFTPDGKGGYTAPEDETCVLTLDRITLQYCITEKDGTSYFFDYGMGWLEGIEDKSGNTLKLERNENGYLSGLVTAAGDRIRITTDRDGHITVISLPDETSITYTYTNGRLASYTDQNGNTTKYQYDSKGRMTGWTDANGNRQVRNTYDKEGRVVRQYDANGSEYKIAYFDTYTETTNPEGAVSRICFDECGHTTDTIDALGNKIHYEYDASGNITAITDERGNTTYYEYDGEGHKTKETAPDGTSCSFVYDGNGNVTELADQNGNVTKYEYNEENLLIRQTAADGGVTEYEYNEKQQVIRITDPMGGETTNTYDGLNLVSTKDAKGNETRYTYDRKNQLVSTMDAMGNSTYFGYDAVGNLTLCTFADGSVFHYAYDAVGNLLSATDALGNETKYEYDALGQLTATTDANGSRTMTSYDKAGNAVRTIDAGGNESTAEYDAMSRLVQLTDAEGNTTQYTYDKTGNPVLETNALGGKTQYVYNAKGLLTRTIDPDGNTTGYTYDAAGNIQSVTTPNAGTTVYEYDGMNRQTATVDPNGGRTEYTYDFNGNITSVTDPRGGVTTYTYDALGNVLTITDALGCVTTYEYDALSRPTCITDANGGATTYAYDKTGNLQSETDALGHKTEYEYDKNGNITTFRNALGTTQAMEYDAIGNVVKVLQANGGIVTAEYDESGNLVSQTDPMQSKSLYSYDKNGRLQQVTDAKGDTAGMTHDALGNVVSVTEADGSLTKYEYSTSGRLNAEIDAVGCRTEYTYGNGNLVKTTVNGNETIYEYDNAGNILSVEDAEGRKVRFEYDAANNLTAILYPDDTKDVCEYDALDRLVKTTARTGEETVYTYDALGNVVTVDEDGQITSYEYDLLSRTTAVISNDGARTEYEYDALGNLTGETDPLGNRTGYVYTVDSLIQSITYANGGTFRAEYDKNGRRIAETDPEGGETGYTYDQVGRLTAVTDALGAVTEYVYDKADNLTTTIDANGNETTYAYDRNGNLTRETDPLGNTTKYTYTKEGWLKTITDAEGHTTRYTYDRTGELLTAEYADGQQEESTYNEIGKLTSVTTEAGVTEYQYDEQGRLICVTDPDGTSVKYAYDVHGNRTGITYPDGKKASYEYDDRNRLVTVKGTDGKKTEYTYDANGQRIRTEGDLTATSYTYDSVGNLISQKTTGEYEVTRSYTYDKAGRMLSETEVEKDETTSSYFAYDQKGQLTSFQTGTVTEQYTYDPVGNMLQKTKNGESIDYRYNAGNQLTEDGTYRYTYDRIGNLVEKSTSTQSIQYTYTAQNLLKSWTDGENTEDYEYNASGLISRVTSNGSTTDLTWDILRGDGDLLCSETDGERTDYTYGLERISSKSGSTRTEYVYDARGSVRAEVSENVAWYTLGGLLSKEETTTKRYTPFGEQLGEVTSGFGWNGEYYNATTGQVYLRARFYEPEMNRFSQKDIVKGTIIDGTSLNRYLYCENDPVNYIDPNGESLKSIVQSAAKKVKSVATKAVSAVKTVATKTVTAAKTTATKAATSVKSTVSKAVTSAKTTATKVVTTVKNTATKAATSINNAAATVKTSVSDAYNKTAVWYQENKTVVNAVAGATVLAGLGVATIVTGGATAPLLVAAVKGAAIGTAAGAAAGALNYYIQNDCSIKGADGTYSGFGSAILESAASGFALGSVFGGIAGISSAVSSILQIGTGAIGTTASVSNGVQDVKELVSTLNNPSSTGKEKAADVLAVVSDAVELIGSAYLFKSGINGLITTQSPQVQNPTGNERYRCEENESAGFYKPDGDPKWPANNGFEGEPTSLTLNPGTFVDRYGYDSGKFVSPKGTPYTERSLPMGTEQKPYTVFEVVEPVEVQAGITAPWFGEKGGGIQYMFSNNISSLVDQGVLRKVVD